ncbi:pentatricopeptide repeat-containing protein At1g74600, chloroplastic-like [Eucalyptus grandis]|uniref:pentatricopeptide repeat-containing protein At1g74600, chloroplastic-like n=1 Tax=Eucalyptus grandis TaxID=71139 RepID=UPI00192EF031|nr:pentatricopeptide repeat-containing protein At1g74600, chloroplastic-like [Eucalyptus grandis]
MRELGFDADEITYGSVISACAALRAPPHGRQVYSLALRKGFRANGYVRAGMIDLLTKNHRFDDALRVFRDVSCENVVCWNAIIAGAVRNGENQIALDLFRQLCRHGTFLPNSFTFPCVLTACAMLEDLETGKMVQGWIIKCGNYDVYINTSLSDLYAKCKGMEGAMKIFTRMCLRSVVSWTAMISGFLQLDDYISAVLLFKEMRSLGEEINTFTITSLLSASGRRGLTKTATQFHALIIKCEFDLDPAVGASLFNMYCKVGAVDSSGLILEEMERMRNPNNHAVVISLHAQANDAKRAVELFGSMLREGYAQNGYIEEALLMFHKMLKANFAVDSFSISSVVQAVTLTNRLDIGTQLQSYAMKVGLDSNAAVGSSLVAMYSKFGGINECVKAYDQIDAPDLIGWTTMIMSYARHGIGEEALKFFKLMKREKMRPDPVTFVGVLSACSHSGLVEEGYFHFDSMVKDYGIEPNYRHYACMVDLLGRSGRLKEAERFISNMPIKPNALVWETLLAACKLHGDIELGKLAAKKITECEPSDAGAYISLSNIYADMGQWGEVMNIRSSMKGAKVKKEPGWSAV